MMATVIPTLRYRDAPTAIQWLCNVIGFERHAVYPNSNGTIGHAELKLGGGMIMLGSQRDDEYGRGFKSPSELGGIETRSTYVSVQDIDSVFARAEAAGATIERPIKSTDYASREFRLRDPEGHTWTVGTYDPWSPQS